MADIRANEKIMTKRQASIFLALMFFVGSRFAFATPTHKKVIVGIASNFSEVASNSYNPMGNPFKNGVTLALDQLKKIYPNLEIELKEFDYGSEDVKVLQVAKNAAASDASIVLGYEYSSHALLAASVHQENSLPMLTPSASADRLGNFGKFVHTGSFSNSYQAEILAELAFRGLSLKRAAIVVAADCAYCQDLAAAFSKHFSEIGGTVVDSFQVLQEQTDFDAVFKNFTGDKYDFVFAPNQEFTSGRIVKALFDAGFHKPFLGGDGWRQLGGMMFTETYQGKFQGYMTAHWHPDLATRISGNFKTEFEKKFGTTPTDSAALSFDSMMWLGSALSNLSDFSREAVEKELSDTNDFSGVTGQFIFSETGAPRKSILILKAGSNDFKIDRIIEPTAAK